MQLEFSTPPLFGDPRLPLRFWAKVKVIMPSGCWEWQASLNLSGYGKFHVGSVRDHSRRILLPHRVAYETLIGPMPAGLESDHLCRNRACVNPTHIEPVIHSVNSQRSPCMAKGEAHGRAKLKTKDIFAIRALEGRLRQAELGKRLGVNQTAISKIQRRQNWAHI